MLVQFSVGNFLSFKDIKTLSLEASSISEHKSNVFVANKEKLLKSAVLYGANASGKSNLLKAMATMRELILNSLLISSFWGGEFINIEPFRLDPETEHQPSFFEIVFIKDKTIRYGFELDRKKIHTEWLFIDEKEMFTREFQNINVSKSFPEGKNLEDKTRENVLFLTVVNSFNGTWSKKIVDWFKGFYTISGIRHQQYFLETIKLLENSQTKANVIELFKNLDLGFEDLIIKENQGITIDIDGIRIGNGKSIYTIHKRFNQKTGSYEPVEFSLKNNESAGTQKIFDLAGVILQTLLKGKVLIVDELDTKLHPLLTLSLIKLFNSEENKKNAQLIFATHDTNLLAYGNFRRDQIYFVEKDNQGASDLYSLVEIKEVRSQNNFEKQYIEGKYGAIPFIGDLSKILQSNE